MNTKQMIKFCREKIIMANNPECKTYEEALYVEFNKIGCIIEAYHKYCTVGDGSSMHEDYVILCQDGKWKTYGTCGNEIRYFIQNQYQDCIHEYTILGLPLTLERVLVALYTHKQIQPLISYTQNGDMSISIFLEKDLNIQAIATYGIKASSLFTWQPNTTLESQHDKTIEAIYNILKNNE